MRSQHESELFQFVKLLGELECQSYLEIGALEGYTFFCIGSTMKTATAVDMPGAIWGDKKCQVSLMRRRDMLRNRCGTSAHVILGDSTDAGVIQKAEYHGPYDAIFIDGDHRYEGVKKDWENYRGFARKVVAFHDIVAHGAISSATGDHVEVPRLWQEIKQTHQTIEIIEAGAERPLGIGVVVL